MMKYHSAIHLTAAAGFAVVHFVLFVEPIFQQIFDCSGFCYMIFEHLACLSDS